MIINCKDLRTFNGRLLSINISPASKDIKFEFTNDKSLVPVKTKDGNCSYKKVELEIEIYAASRNEYEICKSNLSIELEECELQFEDIPNKTYTGYLDGDIDTTEKGTGIGVLKCTIYAICEGLRKNNSFSSDSVTVTNEGNIESGAIISVQPNVSLTSITISGLTENPITVNNVGSDYPLIINGEKCLITQNGINKFGDSDLWDFPVMKPGKNTVRISTACSSMLSYKPRFK